MIFYYKKGKNAAQTAKKICAVMYGDNTVAERTVRKWFARFKSGDFSVKEKERSGRAVEMDNNQIKNLIETNPRYTSRDIANILQISHPTVLNHLRKLGFVNQLDVWVPHELSKKKTSWIPSASAILY